MAQYPSYKNSGFDWIGQIPSHWVLLKSKFLWRESFNTSATGTEDLLSVSQYDGITPANGSRSESLVGYKVVEENNLVINIMLAWMGGLGMSAYNGLVSPAYCVYKLQGDNSPKYMHYLYKTPMYLAEFARHSTGVIPSRWRMYTDDFGQVLTLIPPRKEQDAMVAYLDAATAKIDEAIAQQQRMIDLLNERKELLIENEVTKGIKNGTWKTRRLRHVCKFRNGYTPSKNVTAYWENGTIPWFRMEDIHLYGRKLSQSEQYITPSAVKGDGLFKAGSFILATSATVGEHALLLVDALSNQRFTNLALFEELSNELSTEYFFYFLYHIDRECRGFTNGSTFASVSNQDLKNILVGIPSPEEQRRIVSMLDTETFKIDNALELVSQQIQFLQERKQIIINDVVTGKVRIV